MKAWAAVVSVWAVAGTAGMAAGKSLLPRDLARPGRIVGGEPVARGEALWQVSLQYGNSHFCGGTLVTPSLVVTAAHCTMDIEMKDVRVITGAWDLTEKLHRVHRVVGVSRAKFNRFTLENDIALIVIKESIETASNSSLPQGVPIALETRKNNGVGMTCMITGWGRLSDGGKLPDRLMAANVKLRSDAECKNIFISRSLFHLFESNLCAGGGDQDACQGDSGGPMVCCSDSTRSPSSCRLAGITSWGIGCATPYVPGVYTEVAYFVKWIKKTLRTEYGEQDLKRLSLYTGKNEDGEESNHSKRTRHGREQ